MTLTTASRAPWDGVPPEEQLFVLITGANSGVGLAIAQRLIDEFLASRPPTAHLVLLPTTRSAEKSLAVIASLRAYAAAALARRPSQTTSKENDKDREKNENEKKDRNRIHIISLPLDLCDVRGVYAFADTLSRRTVSNPPGLDAEYLVDVALPRLDTVIFNAAFGGWGGLNIPNFVVSVLTRGLFQAFTWPTYLLSLPDRLLNDRPRYALPAAAPPLAEVFTACVFGHYLLARRLLPLLRRPPALAARGMPPARVVWCSSLDACRSNFRPDDPQCLLRPDAYESSKRLIDVLSLTAALPATRPHVARYFAAAAAAAAADDDDEESVPPTMYVTHPGVVVSTLFPVPAFLVWTYRIAIDLVRWLGSPWHVAQAYLGAFSAVWIALSSQDELEHARAHRSKWGSACGRDLVPYVKATEVEGWGWDGRPETAEGVAADTAEGGRSKACGRKADMPETTPEDLVDFEETGAQAWAAMEALRLQWEKTLEIGDFA
ncbi:3-keto-steroid reductase [Escovopsis weberi]|uniref:3-keto-steroid reductase n=1 Tax=Escovopsis weberi TaxID=150374 RepID=A0A0M8N1B8_ESCWE|nr:3-keto-steroid reductase [Escovopsis weberi]